MFSLREAEKGRIHRKHYKQTLYFTPNKAAAAEAEQKITTGNIIHRENHHPQPYLLTRGKVTHRDTTLPTDWFPFPDTNPSFSWCPLPSREGRHSQGMAFLGNGIPNGEWTPQGRHSPMDGSPPFPRSGRGERDQGDSSRRIPATRYGNSSRTRQQHHPQPAPATEGGEEEDPGPGTATRPGTVRG